VAINFSLLSKIHLTWSQMSICCDGHAFPLHSHHSFRHQPQSRKSRKNDAFLPGEVLESVYAIAPNTNAPLISIRIDNPIFRHTDRTVGVLRRADRRLERPDRTLTLLRLGLKFLDLEERESSTTNDRFQWDFANDRSSLH
jgi:hypothetical protein